MPPKSRASTSSSKSGAAGTAKSAPTSSTTTTKSSTTSRRSSRRAATDPVVAPGYGTRKDLQRLANELSAGDAQPVSVEAVAQMMHARGVSGSNGGAGTVSTPTINAWADFMMEEGVEPASAGVSTATNANAANTNDKNATTTVVKGSALGEGASKGTKREYDLDSVFPSVKKKKIKLEGGVLVQSGTLDVSIVGRSKSSSNAEEPWSMQVPTRLLSTVKVAKVFTSSTAVHSICTDVNGNTYGWGRNEHGQLGIADAPNVFLPTVLDLPDGPVVQAALGKSHTLFLTTDALYAVGLNKSGQCGVRSFMENVQNYRKCAIPDDIRMVKIACGEDFSVALSSEGHLYTTGSSEYGQLGNGETGEYFVTANKIAFANCNVFTKRTVFCHEANSKVVPLQEEQPICLVDIACGKHHTLAVEAPSDQNTRVFSWGCGDYGCLGHEKQADEYYPRLIENLKYLPKELFAAAGAHCSLLRTSRGHVYYWGKHRSMGEATMRPQLVDALANNQHYVTHCAAGGQTVVCCTAGAQTVAWGQGPHGELGLGKAKSSSKPTFVPSLEGTSVMDVACGYGHTLYVIKNTTAEEKSFVEKLPLLDPESCAQLEGKKTGTKK